MPNWTFNKLKIKGEKDKIIQFKEMAKNNSDELLSFDNFLPTPKELVENESPPKNEEIAEKGLEKYNARDWYEWRIKYWGVKWNPGDVKELDFDSYSFFTAGGVPDTWLQIISTLFPSLTFILKAKEECNLFSPFMLIVNDGKIIEKELISGDFTSTDFMPDL